MLASSAVICREALGSTTSYCCRLVGCSWQLQGWRCPMKAERQWESAVVTGREEQQWSWTKGSRASGKTTRPLGRAPTTGN